MASEEADKKAEAKTNEPVGEQGGRAKRERKQVEFFKVEAKEKEEFVIKQVGSLLRLV